MDLQIIHNTGAALLTETTEIAEKSIWEKLMSIELGPEAQRDLLLYVLLMVLLCAISKIVYDVKENRRLKKELAAYQQRREDEEAGRG